MRISSGLVRCRLRTAHQDWQATSVRAATPRGNGKAPTPSIPCRRGNPSENAVEIGAMGVRCQADRECVHPRAGRRKEGDGTHGRDVENARSSERPPSPGAVSAGGLAARPLAVAQEAGWPKLPPVRIHVVYVGTGGAWPTPTFDAPAEVAKFKDYLAGVETPSAT